jgi:hypothetical protein
MVAFKFTGPLGKDLFDHIGPDIEDACGAGPDHRTRSRDDLDCLSRQRRDRVLSLYPMGNFRASGA